MRQYRVTYKTPASEVGKNIKHEFWCVADDPLHAERQAKTYHKEAERISENDVEFYDVDAIIASHKDITRFY